MFGILRCFVFESAFLRSLFPADFFLGRFPDWEENVQPHQYKCHSVTGYKITFRKSKVIGLRVCSVEGS